jgi:hypothetical protein
VIRGRLTSLLVSVGLLALAWPASSWADHLVPQASVSATLEERRSADSWSVRVRWDGACAGASDPSFQFQLHLVDADTGDRLYVAGGPQPDDFFERVIAVSALAREQHLFPELEISCFETEPELHGSDTITVRGEAIFIPPSFARSGGGGGPGDGGPGGDYGTGDPTEPLGGRGCLTAIVGTNAPDRLVGDEDGEVIFGFDAADRIRGSRGHDCLIGGKGGDRLKGEAGKDRLTGGRGNDVLLGGADANAYDAGPGRDFVNARNGKRELVRCGSGRDRARVDGRDRIRSCERVLLPVQALQRTP